MCPVAFRPRVRFAYLCFLPTQRQHPRFEHCSSDPPGSHGAPRREEQIPPYHALRTPIRGAFLCAPWLFDRGCVLPASVSCRRKDSTRGSNTALRIPPGSHGASRREEQIPPYRALRDSSFPPTLRSYYNLFCHESTSDFAGAPQLSEPKIPDILPVAFPHQLSCRNQLSESPFDGAYAERRTHLPDVLL